MEVLQTIGLAFIVVVVVSIDLFACGLNYGAQRIRVPWKHLFVINIVGSILIGAALVVGFFVGHVIPESVGELLPFVVFYLLASFKLIIWLWQYGTPGAVLSKNITIRESFILAVILAIDGMLVAFGAAMDWLSVVFVVSVIVISLVFNIVFFRVGQGLGKTLVRKTNINLGWLGAIALYIIAVVQLFI